jgi:AraC-like DNA-binding protein
MLADGLYLSERQLHRRIQLMLGVTPNKFIRMIKLQMAREAVAGGKHHTMAEISRLAGFETTAYFKKLFKEAYGREITDPGK